MDIQELSIPGCYLIKTSRFEDLRGSFVKTFNAKVFSGFGVDFDVQEEYFSISKKGVIRGLHFQTPPFDHEKLIYCLLGEVFDVFLDLRKLSPTYGKHCSVTLSEKNGYVLYLPKGTAHGFLSRSNNSLMVYKTSTVYNPDHDSGLLWSSCGIDWPESEYIVSDRDTNFKKFTDFESPF